MLCSSGGRWQANPYSSWDRCERWLPFHYIKCSTLSWEPACLSDMKTRNAVQLWDMLAEQPIQQLGQVRTLVVISLQYMLHFFFGTCVLF
jgi:hypothetical protein